MRRDKLTACTAALLLSSTALLAQEAQTFQNVYVDVDGAAVLIPVELALEACGLDEAGIQQAAASRFEESGFDATMVQNLFDEAGPTSGTVAAAGAQDIAAAGAGDTADIDVIAMPEVDTEGSAADGAGTTMTSHANMTTDAGNTTTDAGNQTAGAETTSATGTTLGQEATAGGAEIAATGTDGQVGGDTTAGAEVGNVQSTAADTADSGLSTNAQGTADATTADPGDEFLVLAVCQLDVVRASELGVPTITNETVTD